MKEELHSIKAVYKGVVPYVKVTAYELSAIDCSATDMSGYYGQESTLISDDPAPGYDFANWSVTGSNVTGNNVTFKGDITAKANYSAHKYNVTLQNDGHGTIAASKTTGNIGDTITLSNTPNTNYGFSGYSITGSTLTGNAFTIGTSNVTAKGWFSALPSYTLTLQTDGHGTLTANKITGYAGDTVTLTPTYNTYYRFNNYSNTGGSINGNTFTFGNGNATAKANFKTNTFTVTGSKQNAGSCSTAAGGWTTATMTVNATVGGITGSVPTAWGTVNNQWKPNGASAYSMTIGATATASGPFRMSKSMYVGIFSGTSPSHVASTSTDFLAASYNISISNTITAQTPIMVSAYLKNKEAAISTTYYLTAKCNFTATGIAP